ncbi:MAG TPA: hypothetical protein VJB57_14800 [Dehalococcoidia bacterium]|nr:hypothetical protein [Dehalococcoidia bacterium]
MLYALVDDVEAGGHYPRGSFIRHVVGVMTGKQGVRVTGSHKPVDDALLHGCEEDPAHSQDPLHFRQGSADLRLGNVQQAGTSPHAIEALAIEGQLPAVSCYQPTL